PPVHPGDVHHLDLRQHRHVVRALRHHRDVLAPRLPPGVVGLLPPDGVRRLDVPRHAGTVLHALPPVPALPADDRHRRDQGRHAHGGPSRQGAWLMSTAASLSVERPQARVFGLVAEFKNPHALIEGVKAIRKAGFTRIDTHTPFPIHGMDRAMGLPQSKLPWLVFAGGMTGVSSAVLLQWWMNAFDYPFRVGGKPFFSYQAYVPVCFELTVLL